MTDAPVKRRNNALTHAQSARLYAWLEAHRAEVATQTAFPVALQAQIALGFDVTEHNVLSAKRALKIVKPAPVVVTSECRCRELAAVIADWCGSPLPDRNALLYDLHKFLGKPMSNAPALPGIGGEGAAA